MVCPFQTTATSGPPQTRDHAEAPLRAVLTALGEQATQGAAWGPGFQEGLGKPFTGLTLAQEATRAHYCTHICTWSHSRTATCASQAHTQRHSSGDPSLLLSPPLLPREWGRVGQAAVQCQGRARLLNARTAPGLNGQGLGCQSASQSSPCRPRAYNIFREVGFLPSSSA